MPAFNDNTRVQLKPLTYYHAATYFHSELSLGTTLPFPEYSHRHLEPLRDTHTAVHWDDDRGALMLHPQANVTYTLVRSAQLRTAPTTVNELLSEGQGSEGQGSEGQESEGQRGD